MCRWLLGPRQRWWLDADRPEVTLCSGWLGLVLKGGPESVSRTLGGLCHVKMLSNALILSSAEVPFTTSTSAYLVSGSMTTKMYLPHGLGPQ